MAMNSGCKRTHTPDLSVYYEVYTPEITHRSMVWWGVHIGT